MHVIVHMQLFRPRHTYFHREREWKIAWVCLHCTTYFILTWVRHWTNVLLPSIIYVHFNEIFIWIMRAAISMDIEHKLLPECSNQFTICLLNRKYSFFSVLPNQLISDSFEMFNLTSEIVSYALINSKLPTLNHWTVSSSTDWVVCDAFLYYTNRIATVAFGIVQIHLRLAAVNRISVNGLISALHNAQQRKCQKL